MPQEWPIAAAAADRDAPARAAGRGRLRTVRVDFFLNPAERLTEQERALMTAMLHCLIADIASELRAALPPGWVAANEDETAIVDALTRAQLLDEADLVGLLLRRADEERIGSAARARSGRRDARVLQGLVSHDNGPVSAAAMALILARGRRRDRFGQCLVDYDDLAFGTAAKLAYAIAAALRAEIGSGRGTAAADAALSAAAANLVARHDPPRSIEALTGILVALLDEAGGLTDDFLLACAHEGEVGFLAEVLARRCGIASAVAVEEMLSGKPASLVGLLRVAGFSRDLSAGMLASIGDLLGIADAGAAISTFDRLSAEEVEAKAAWLAASPAYRAALDALGTIRG